MSESERRRKYRYDRVLIETERILTPEFDDAVVFLSGAQIEMLRNMTQYLRKLDTYVTVYNPGYYLAPTVADYDAILAIVADLEETLMGNPNTIWGYKETHEDAYNWGDTTAGTHYLQDSAVPAGSVRKVEGFAFQNNVTVMTRVIVKLKRSSVDYILLDTANPAAGVWHAYSCDNTLVEGDYIEYEFRGVALHDSLSWQSVGWQMDVPT